MTIKLWDKIADVNGNSASEILQNERFAENDVYVFGDEDEIQHLATLQMVEITTKRIKNISTEERLELYGKYLQQGFSVIRKIADEQEKQAEVDQITDLQLALVEMYEMFMEVN